MWELLPIDSNGAMPDPNNPMHFVRATDRKGNPHRIILNGRGVPAGTVVPLGTLFLCISDADDNTNKPLSNTKVWIPVINPGTTDPTTIDTSIIPPWNDGVAYRRGNLVTNAFGDYFVALRPSVGVLPSDLGIVEHPEIWFKLPVAPANRGLYDPTVNYVLSDYVQAIAAQRAGILHIELHPEVDFVFLLGVPAIL
jgi:hypothetical protein